MTVNIDNKFKNPLLDIQYDLTQNHIHGEELLELLKSPTSDTIIKEWKCYLSFSISRFKAINDMTDILCSDYKFDEWFHTGKNSIARYLAEKGVPENTKKLINLKVSVIGSEIYKFIKILGKLKCCLSKVTLREFLPGLQITEHDTIDYTKTAIYLIDINTLQLKYKYAIACYFCLEEKIREFHGEILKLYGLGFPSTEEDRLMVFWTYNLYFKENNVNEINKPSNSSGAYTDQLLYWAIQRENEPAVHYIWTRFRHVLEKEMENFIIYSLRYNSTNITFYLISQVNDEGILERLCKVYGHTILIKLQFNLRWRNYCEGAVNYIQEFISEMDFLTAIKSVIVFWFEKNTLNDSHLILLNGIREKFRVNINVDFLLQNSMMTYLIILLHMEDEITMKLLLNVGSNGELKLLFERNVLVQQQWTLSFRKASAGILGF